YDSAAVVPLLATGSESWCLNAEDDPWGQRGSRGKMVQEYTAHLDGEEGKNRRDIQATHGRNDLAEGRHGRFDQLMDQHENGMAAHGGNPAGNDHHQQG